MTELDSLWSKMLDEAAAKSLHLGQSDIAEYLRLKAANDTIRSIGVGWLMDTVIEIAGQLSRDHAVLVIEREEPHSFAHGNSNMAGSLLRVSYGVRCLTLEAGWTRTPRDGIMHGHTLAFARISHFGLLKKGAEFRLVHSETLPQWLDKTGNTVDSSELRRHLDMLLDK